MTQINVYFDRLKKTGVHRTAVKNDFLHIPNTSQSYIYCLEEGVCALTSTNKNDEEKIYQYFKSGDLMGYIPHYMNLYEPNTCLDFSIVAKSDCTFYEIPYDAFTQFLDLHPQFYPWLLEQTIYQYTGLLTHIYHLEDNDNLSNLCKTLLELATIKDGKLHLHKCFSYAEIAKYIDVHVITVTRLMKRLKDEGIIFKRGHHTIIADPIRLSEYIG